MYFDKATSTAVPYFRSNNQSQLYVRGSCPHFIESHEHREPNIENLGEHSKPLLESGVLLGDLVWIGKQVLGVHLLA
jgi:hypothetical protein